MTGNIAPARRRARRAAVQAVYQWQISKQNIGEIEQQFREEHARSEKIDIEYFSELLHGVAKNKSSLDESLAPCISRPMEEVSPVESAVLRVAAYELLHRPDIPYRVVINEAVDLAKRFGADQAHRFVNGAVDALAKSVRSVEVSAQQNK